MYQLDLAVNWQNLGLLLLFYGDGFIVGLHGEERTFIVVLHGESNTSQASPRMTIQRIVVCYTEKATTSQASPRMTIQRMCQPQEAVQP